MDNDCDGAVDDADSSVDTSTMTTWYVDSDGDGFGGGLASNACAAPTSNSITQSGDCDDSSAAINPNAQEVCDTIDNDCDGSIDDADGSVSTSTMTTWYTDSDGDGFGGSTSTLACAAPTSNSITQTGDCNDSSAAINPNAQEVCDNVDNDCDGATDDADGSVDTSTMTTWYTDSDGDGYGGGSSNLSCAVPSNAATLVGDCDDSNGSVYPNAPEDWDCVDTNCDGFSYPVGDGRDGVLTVSGSTNFSTSSTTLSSSMSAGQTQVAVSNGGIFSPGDYVLFWDSYGSTAGQWSVEYIDSISGNTLNLATPVDSSGASGTTWAIRMPQYTDVNIQSGTLTAPGFWVVLVHWVAWWRSWQTAR